MRAGGAEEIRVVTRPEKEDLADHARGVGIVAARLLNEDGTVQPNVTLLPSPSVTLVQASA